jgi:CHAT domain
MDIITVLTTFLSPFLPFLLDLGKKATEKATESAAGKFGESAWKKAEGVWDNLQPQVEATPDVKAAIEQVAAKPDSEARQAVLREELAALFKAQPELLRTIAQIMQDDNSDSAPRTQIQQTISGGMVFNITDTTIGNLAGSGNIYAQEVIQQPEPMQSPPSAQSAIARSVKTILILSANPRGTNTLRLAEEVRELRRGLERSRHRDDFKIEQRSALTAQDLRRALIDCQPQVVHFAGHGVGHGVSEDTPDARKLTAVGDVQAEDGLVLEDESGQIQLVSGAAIAQLFEVFANTIECVVLNACYSEVQAKAIAQYIPHVVGMKWAIGDRAAIEFAIGFYDGLLGGRSVRDAYQLGCSAIQLAGIPEDLIPVLLPF